MMTNEEKTFGSPSKNRARKDKKKKKKKKRLLHSFFRYAQSQKKSVSSMCIKLAIKKPVIHHTNTSNASTVFIWNGCC